MNRFGEDWFGPKAGLLAAGKSLPQRQPPPPPVRQYREGIDAIPNAGPLREQPTIGGLNQALQQPFKNVEEDISQMPKKPMGGEYLPLPGEELTLGDIIQRFSPRTSGSF